MKMSKLLALALVLLISVGTLAGSTIAWFTDSVTSSGNIIKSGTLDAEMWYKDEAGNLKDASQGAIFNYQNWEPGFTQVKELTLKNVGSLAFEYDLRVFPTTEVVAGETNLADVIEVYYGSGAAPTSLAGVEAGTLAGTISAPIEANKAQGILLPAEGKGSADVQLNDADKDIAKPGEATMWIALHMQEEAGNEYQGLSVGDGFAVQMLATQYTYENDSFGNTYDEGAEMPEVAANTAELVELLNDGKSAKLTANLALKDAKIDIPAGSDVTLDLNGYTISGQSTASTTSNLIQVKEGSTLTLKNGTVAFAATKPDVEWGGEGQPAFPGYANNTISLKGKLVIDGATVKNMTAPGGASYAIDCYPGADLIINSGTIDGCGKIAIRMFCNSNTVDTKVTVNGGTVTGSRAIWVQLPSGAETRDVANVQKANLTVNGGKLVSTDETYNLALYVYSYGSSYDNTYVTLNGGTYYGNVAFGGYGNTVPAGKEKIVIDKDNCEFYGSVYSYLDNGALDSSAYTSAGAYAVSDDGLEKALEEGETNIVVGAGEYGTFPSISDKSVVITCEEGTVFEGKSGLSIGGATVIGATFSNDGDTASSGTVNGTFKDCTFEGKNGLRWCYAGETVVFENCVFDGSTYGVHFDGGANNVTFKNCTISGFNAFGGAIKKLTLEGCTFKCTGKSNYNGVNLWGNTDLKDCTFIFDGKAETEWVDLCTGGLTVTFTNCVVTNGTTETPIKDVVGNYGNNNTIIIDGTTVDIPNMA